MAVSIYIPANSARGLGKMQLELNLKMVNTFKRRLLKGLNCVRVCVNAHTHTHTSFSLNISGNSITFFFFKQHFPSASPTLVCIKGISEYNPPFRFSQSDMRPRSKHSQEDFPFLCNSGTCFIFFFLFSKGKTQTLQWTVCLSSSWAGTYSGY